MKKCKTCGKVKSLEQFSINRECKGGRSWKCKECRNAQNRDLNSKNKERYGKVRAVWCEKNKDKMSKYHKKYNASLEVKKRRAKNALSRTPTEKARFKRRMAASQKLRYHVNANNIKKPLKCECCNNNTLIHGHHENYNYSLNVIWLCRRCHTNNHRGEGEKAVKIRLKIKALYKQKYTEGAR